MSSSAMSLSAHAVSPAINWSRVALVGPATVLAAVAANAVFYFIAGTLVAYDAQFLPLASVGGAVIMTLASAIVAVLLYAALLRFTRRPNRIFTIISAIVFVISLVPVFTYIPTVPGVTSAQIATLVTMHVVAATVIVAALTSIRRTPWVCVREGTPSWQPDLPCDDDSAGLIKYADTVVDAIGDTRDLTVVAQSLAGFTAPLVC
jgi:Family of unknown function (DUF6069)